MAKRRFRFYIILFIALLLTSGALLFNREHPVRPSPTRTPQKKYAYYRIIDEKTKKNLMTVSSAPVMQGDELITGDNKRYVVVKVKGNTAYARYVETVKLEGD